jgi:hypothetical protein
MSVDLDYLPRKSGDREAATLRYRSGMGLSRLPSRTKIIGGNAVHSHRRHILVETTFRGGILSSESSIARYLSDLQDKFGCPGEALASFNSVRPARFRR